MKSIQSSARYLICFICFLIFNVSVLFSQDTEIFKNPEEVLGIVGDAFLDNDQQLLEKISSYAFYKSEGYAQLKEWLSGMYMNVNSREELIEKEFAINGDPKKLVVIFGRDKINRTWYVEDAFFREEENIENIDKNSFSPLSYADFFNDFLVAFEKKDKHYFGIGPYGKLSMAAVDSLGLQLSNASTITYKNIILHDGEKPLSFIYVKFKDYPCNNTTDKCGWLLDKIGGMEEFYENDIFVQYLMNKSKFPDLTVPNKVKRSIDLTQYINHEDYLGQIGQFDMQSPAQLKMRWKIPDFQRSKVMELPSLPRLEVKPKCQKSSL